MICAVLLQNEVQDSAGTLALNPSQFSVALVESHRYGSPSLYGGLQSLTFAIVYRVDLGYTFRRGNCSWFVAFLLTFCWHEDVRLFAGATHYVRTCSNNLNHRLSLSLVCMKESPPGDGRLCFCHRPLCNSVPAPVVVVWHRPPCFSFVLLLLLLLRHALVTVA